MILPLYLALTTPKFFFRAKWNINYVFIHTHKIYLLMLVYYLYLDMNTQTKSLIDFTAADYLSKIIRFQLIYNMLSITYNYRVIIHYFLSEMDFAYSLNYLFPNSSWYERECWDLFGIFFYNNVNLKRILLDYGFSGHPFRKDFPLIGFTEVVYSYFLSSVIKKKVKIVQQFRHYDLNIVWNFLDI